MCIFENLGMCHNTDGIAPPFAQPDTGAGKRASGTNAQELCVSEMLVLTMLAKQLFEA